ncbi:MAG: hypothetical protein ABI443_03775 [Chthoniobacterales bacterium]
MKSNQTTATLLSLALISGSVLQVGAALSDSDLASKEAKITVGAATDENAALREKMLLQQSTIQAMTESLVKVSNESEAYKREAADLRMKIEALGLPGDQNGNRLQQRLLAAVSDLRIAQNSQQEMRAELLQLSEAIITLMKSSDKIDPQLRLTVETQLRSAKDMLNGEATNAGTTQSSPTLLNGTVIDVKDSLSLVVANVGTKQAVKLGMPFQVLRDNEVIGEIRVVDVRDRICGALVQNLSSEKQRIQVGDQLKVEARQ